MTADFTYNDLYTRNTPLISSELQNRLSKLRVSVAGCGSTGGAVIDGLLRLGVQNFRLCDNGEYEINNLNRQMVFLSDIEKNKAFVHQQRILQVNPFAEVQIWTGGFQKEMSSSFFENCDFAFDAIDVTEQSGMKAKLNFHEQAHSKKVAVASALDLGWMQWIESYNYHQGEFLLKNRMNKALSAQHPLKRLVLGFIDINELPTSMIEEVNRLLTITSDSEQTGACQLGSACFLLSALISPYIIHFVQTDSLPPKVIVDLEKYFPILNSPVDRVTVSNKLEYLLGSLI